MINSEIQNDKVAFVAQNVFGIKYLYPYQRLVIENILESSKLSSDIDISEYDGFGKQIVLLPTGAGKSLCFLVPAMILQGATLVIYPLLALMSDQMRRMNEANLHCVVFRGGQSMEEREDNFLKIKNGAKVILANPEVLQNEDLLERLSSCNISHIAIDEAHCVAEWGDTFRPAYLTLGKIIQKLKVPVVTAFTATASPQILSRISEVLFDGNVRIVKSESDRANIKYYVNYTYNKKYCALMLAKSEMRPMIIFCGTRAKAENISRELNVCYGNNISKFYHAGLEKSEKDDIEKWFFDKDDAILCATCAYGMGVDKKNIRTVIHIDSPNSAEQYIQEAGRSGRDGKDAKAILLWAPEDSDKFSKYAKNTRESYMKQFAETTECRRQVLLDALDAEKAACSGCDICDSKNSKTISNKEISESEFIFNFIKSHRNLYTFKELTENILPVLNNRCQKTLGVSIWNYEYIKEALMQLMIEKKIYIDNFLWKNKVCVYSKTQNKNLAKLVSSTQKFQEQIFDIYSMFTRRKIFSAIKTFINKCLFKK